MAPEMSIRQIERTTPAEIEVIQKAFMLGELERRQLASFTAFQAARAFASDKNGRPLIKKFKDLFNYDKEYQSIFNSATKGPDKESLDRIALINKKALEER